MRSGYALLSLLLCGPAAAQPTTGTCEPGTAAATLTNGRLSAPLFNDGGLFQDFPAGANGYEVDGVPLLYNANLWLGGYVGDSLRLVGAEEGAGEEFWPGPLNPGGTLPDPADCSAFDRIWLVSRADIEAYEQSGTATDDLAEWPADLGAPFHDANDDGAYVLADGDRPSLLGDVAAWWVMNDLGNAHPYFRTAPLGMEVRVHAFAYGGDDAQSNATYYRYTLVYRGQEPVRDAVVGLWVDPDLGSAADDFVGSDPALALGYVFNADETDVFSGAPPAVGVTWLETLGALSFIAPDKSCFFAYSQPCADPLKAYYNSQGRWGDGRAITEGGFGHPAYPGSPSAGPETRWMWPGEVPAFWSAEDMDGQGTRAVPDDQRFVMGSGPFTMAPGDERVVSFAIVASQGADRLDSVRQLKADVAAIRGDNPLPAAAGLPAAGGRVSVFPNPAHTRVTFRYAAPVAAGAHVRLFDVLGREVLDADAAAAGEISVDTAALPGGVYLYQLVVEGQPVRSGRLTVLD